MEEWTLRDSMGLIIVFGVTLSAAKTVDGIAQALIILVGVILAILWIGMFFAQGYTNTVSKQS